MTKEIIFNTPVHKLKVKALRETSAAQLKSWAGMIKEQLATEGGMIMLPGVLTTEILETKSSPLPLSD